LREVYLNLRWDSSPWLASELKSKETRPLSGLSPIEAKHSCLAFSFCSPRFGGVSFFGGSYMETLLSFREVSERLGVSIDTVRNYVSQRKSLLRWNPKPTTCAGHGLHSVCPARIGSVISWLSSPQGQRRHSTLGNELISEFPLIRQEGLFLQGLAAEFKELTNDSTTGVLSNIVWALVDSFRKADSPAKRTELLAKLGYSNEGH